MHFKIVRHFIVALGVPFVALAAGCSGAESSEDVGSVSQNWISTIPNSSTAYVFSNTLNSDGYMVCPNNRVLVGLESFNWALCADSNSTTQTSCAATAIPPSGGIATCPTHKWAAGFKGNGSLWCCGGGGTDGDLNNTFASGATASPRSPQYNSYFNSSLGYSYEMGHCPDNADHTPSATGITRWKRGTGQYTCSQ